MADLTPVKMFVAYNGTKAQFIASNGATTYADRIVFIKGSDSSNSPCIFAQGTYFANFAEMLAAINYVKGISVGGDSYNAAVGGGYIGFNAADPSTVAVNAGQNGIEIGLTSAFVSKVNSTSSDLGSKSDAADKDGSAFARIANLAALVSDLTGGSTESIEGQISAAIDALRTEIVGSLDSADSKTLAAINDELDALGQQITTGIAGVVGTSTDASTANTVYGAKKYAEEKAEAAKTAAVTAANGYTDEKIAEVNEVNSQVAGALNAIIGGDRNEEGFPNKTIREIANDELAKQLIPEGAKESLDTLQEIAAWIQQHPEDASAMNEQITANKNAIALLNGDVSETGSVQEQINSKIAALRNSDIKTKVGDVQSTTLDVSVSEAGENGKTATVNLATLEGAAGSKGGLTAEGTGSVEPNFGDIVSIAGVVVDAYGRVTAQGQPRSLVIPSAVATTSANGLMSKGDKATLDRLNGSKDVTGSVAYQVDQAMTQTKSYIDGMLAWEIVDPE